MIYDCFTYNGEKDMLNIRMAILDEYVDYFVICQSNQTFSGKPKEVEIINHPKVINVISPNMLTADSFRRAGYQKEYLKTALVNCDDDDIIYFGDVDEVWKIQGGVDIDEVYNLKQLNYSYYLNNRSSEEWIGTIVGAWKTIKTKSFNHWRATHTNIRENGGWHFTNMGGPDMVRKKLESYDHQEYNNDENKVLIEDRIKDGEDYVGRETDWQGKPFKFWEDEVDLPQYLLDNKDKYKHLWTPIHQQ